MLKRYSQSEEDYLEAIYLIELKNKVVRVKDVAESVGVTMPSVVSAIRSLSEKGLVEQEQYGHIELTLKGRKVARDVYERHKTLYTFFHQFLGLEAAIAEKDACLMEHHLSPETRQRLLKVLEYVQGCEEVLFLERLWHFIETGDRLGPCSGCGVK
ncbi:MAG TPA: metal-dependent transcriptional regulator [Clostridia bacterium]|jgi:DtxR family Mn-dependent transcriptional regulator|nr:metal-dependent transcriptional regulator [Clostridia bacterium]